LLDQGCDQLAGDRGTGTAFRTFIQCGRS
jgi:hypothetical protein